MKKRKLTTEEKQLAYAIQKKLNEDGIESLNAKEMEFFCEVSGCSPEMVKAQIEIERRIASGEVVPGDLVISHEGKIVDLRHEEKTTLIETTVISAMTMMQKTLHDNPDRKMNADELSASFLANAYLSFTNAMLSKVFCGDSTLTGPSMLGVVNAMVSAAAVIARQNREIDFEDILSVAADFVHAATSDHTNQMFAPEEVGVNADDLLPAKSEHVKAAEVLTDTLMKSASQRSKH